MKFVLLSLILITQILATEAKTKLDMEYIQKEYTALSEEQKQVIRNTVRQGNLLKIKNKSYGITMATFTLMESSAGKTLTCSDKKSFGLTHFTLRRLREILPKHNLYSYLTNWSDKKLIKALKEIPEFSVEVTMLNFKLNYERYKSYRSAVVAHNGFNPNVGFYNHTYWNRFVNLYEVVKLVVQEKQA